MEPESAGAGAGGRGRRRPRRRWEWYDVSHVEKAAALDVMEQERREQTRAPHYEEGIFPPEEPIRQISPELPGQGEGSGGTKGQKGTARARIGGRRRKGRGGKAGGTSGGAAGKRKAPGPTQGVHRDDSATRGSETRAQVGLGPRGRALQRKNERLQRDAKMLRVSNQRLEEKLRKLQSMSIPESPKRGTGGNRAARPTPVTTTGLAPASSTSPQKPHSPSNTTPPAAGLSMYDAGSVVAAAGTKFNHIPQPERHQCQMLSHMIGQKKDQLKRLRQAARNAQRAAQHLNTLLLHAWDDVEGVAGEGDRIREEYGSLHEANAQTTRKLETMLIQEYTLLTGLREQIEDTSTRLASTSRTLDSTERHMNETCTFLCETLRSVLLSLIQWQQLVPAAQLWKRSSASLDPLVNGMALFSAKLAEKQYLTDRIKELENRKDVMKLNRFVQSANEASKKQGLRSEQIELAEHLVSLDGAIDEIRIAVHNAARMLVQQQTHLNKLLTFAQHDVAREAIRVQKLVDLRDHVANPTLGAAGMPVVPPQTADTTHAGNESQDEKERPIPEWMQEAISGEAMGGTGTVGNLVLCGPVMKPDMEWNGTTSRVVASCMSLEMLSSAAVPEAMAERQALERQKDAWLLMGQRDELDGIGCGGASNDPGSNSSSSNRQDLQQPHQSADFSTKADYRLPVKPHDDGGSLSDHHQQRPQPPRDGPTHGRGPPNARGRQYVDPYGTGDKLQHADSTALDIEEHAEGHSAVLVEMADATLHPEHARNNQSQEQRHFADERGRHRAAAAVPPSPSASSTSSTSSSLSDSGSPRSGSVTARSARKRAKVAGGNFLQLGESDQELALRLAARCVDAPMPEYLNLVTDDPQPFAIASQSSVIVGASRRRDTERRSQVVPRASSPPKQNPYAKDTDHHHSQQQQAQAQAELEDVEDDTPDLPMEMLEVRVIELEVLKWVRDVQKQALWELHLGPFTERVTQQQQPVPGMSGFDELMQGTRSASTKWTMLMEQLRAVEESESAEKTTRHTLESVAGSVVQSPSAQKRTSVSVPAAVDSKSHNSYNSGTNSPTPILDDLGANSSSTTTMSSAKPSAASKSPQSRAGASSPPPPARPSAVVAHSATDHARIRSIKAKIRLAVKAHKARLQRAARDVWASCAQHFHDDVIAQQLSLTAGIAHIAYKEEALEQLHLMQMLVRQPGVTVTSLTEHANVFGRSLSLRSQHSQTFVSPMRRLNQRIGLLTTRARRKQRRRALVGRRSKPTETVVVRQVASDTSENLLSLNLPTCREEELTLHRRLPIHGKNLVISCFSHNQQGRLRFFGYLMETNKQFHLLVYDEDIFSAFPNDAFVRTLPVNQPELQRRVLAQLTFIQDPSTNDTSEQLLALNDDSGELVTYTPRDVLEREVQRDKSGTSAGPRNTTRRPGKSAVPSPNAKRPRGMMMMTASHRNTKLSL